MLDEDGQDLSEHFYSKMFSAGAQVASYEKSARALRHATQKLRTEKRVSLERWVNSVHYGACSKNRNVGWHSVSRLVKRFRACMTDAEVAIDIVDTTEVFC
jgi:hypothetical protein